MRRYFKSLIVFMIFVFLLLSFSIDGRAASINIKVNGEDFAQSGEAVIIDNRTYIPVRAFTELLGYYVSWDGKAREAIVTDGKQTTKFFVNSKKVYFDEKILYMDSRAVIIDGRTYAPVRFIAEIYGHEVLWESETSTVLISEIPSYIVQENDTLNIISQKTGIGIDYIMDWNHLSSDMLQIGDKLYLEPIQYKALDDLKTNAVVSYTDEELQWLAKIIYTEARDEPYDGLVAVGAVVLNRIDDKYFPNTIYDVIFQKSQFTPVSTGLIYNVNPDNESYRAAEDALLGTDPTNGALFFNNPSISVSTYFKNKVPIIQIGNHCFYK